MQYALVFITVLIATAIVTYCLVKKGELKLQVASLRKLLQEDEETYAGEARSLREELAKLEEIRHVPDILEKARRARKKSEKLLDEARQRADLILQQAAETAAERVRAETAESAAELLKAKQARMRAEAQSNSILEGARHQANEQIRSLTAAAASELRRSKEARGEAEGKAKTILEEARKEAKSIASQARKDAKEKTGRVEETLRQAITAALEIRRRAEKRAGEMNGRAYDALKRYEHYESAAKAMENIVRGYGGTYMVPSEHVLDELAHEYGFSKAGERLKLARERTRIMEKDGLAASCNYPEGWKRDYAINFVLSAFNGKVDSILAKVKPANKGKLIQEIKDTYALVNLNGEVFRNTRIQEEFLDARLDELKWAVAVQAVKDREREEQRTIREQMREEEKARKEYEKAIKQAQRDEDLINKALEEARSKFEQASEQQKAELQSRIEELNTKLTEAEERNRRALSMAQQTRCGHVYVVSNIGSFGKDVFKIGLTRRLEPTERVRELGGASVPFAFDIHAMIYSEDAPELESKLHKRFLYSQVNKVNQRKEFFRVSIREIKQAVDDLGLEAKWTLTADAAQYRETLALEQAMISDADLRKKWTAEQEAFEDRAVDEEESEELVDELESAI